MDDITHVGLDVHKATFCLAVAEGGRGGEVRIWPEFRSADDATKSRLWAPPRAEGPTVSAKKEIFPHVCPLPIFVWFWECADTSRERKGIVEAGAW
jgi:hypothetical protein